MTLKLLAVPHCCGAKFFFGFPSGYDEDYMNRFWTDPKSIEFMKRTNQELTEALDKELTAFFSADYRCHRVKEVLHDPRDGEERVTVEYFHKHHPLKKNAFISAILNKKQKYVCEPVLFKHGFKLDYQAMNPNSNTMIFHYTKFPNGEYKCSTQ